MKSIMACIVILITMNLLGCASSKWTKADTLREAAFFVVEGMDYLQTKQIVKDPDRQENNPILGSNPDQNTIDIYFGACILGHYLIARYLPSDWEFYGYKFHPRAAWQWTFIGFESGVVYRNHRKGVKIW